jgi:hypothetical protein
MADGRFIVKNIILQEAPSPGGLEIFIVCSPMFLFALQHQIRVHFARIPTSCNIAQSQAWTIKCYLIATYCDYAAGFIDDIHPAFEGCLADSDAQNLHLRPFS